ncbi:hypothetical protein DFH09DRAFT_351405 [Mycena vulgaris]|nr:hypothetical protein DFH09DRAFT_351405 [Mycena vulgaris]
MSDALPLKITMDMLGVQEEMLSAYAPTVGIHDVNRKKIVISAFRPRSKEYVQKQRSIRTLACFATPKPKATSPAPDTRDISITSSETPSTDATPPPANSRARPNPPTMPRAMVMSGRIEKPARSPPRKVQPDAPDLPVDAVSIVAAHYELYSCGCANPSQCRQCTLRRLADKFCAIVTARKERIRQNNAMYS